MNPLEYILGGAVSLAILWGGSAEWRIKNLKIELSDAKNKVLIAEGNADTCKLEIDHINTLLENQRIDYEERLANREVITIEKVIPQYITLEKGDCNETNNVLDFIRSNHP